MTAYLHALDPSGNLVPLRVNADGKLYVDLGALAIGDVEIKNDAGNPVPVSGPLTDTQLRASDVKVTLDGESVAITSGGTSTATLSNVAASASSTAILASNANRKRVVIHNDSTATLYLKFGATASATSYTYLLYGGDTYESPSMPVYTGQIDGIWASATGSARVTEFT
jgi:hypothetical protein